MLNIKKKNILSTGLASRIADAMNHWYEYRDKWSCEEILNYRTESCEVVTPDEVLTMKPVRCKDGHTVYAHQWGDVTILVAIFPGDKLLCKSICW